MSWNPAKTRPGGFLARLLRSPDYPVPDAIEDDGCAPAGTRGTDAAVISEVLDQPRHEHRDIIPLLLLNDPGSKL